MSDAAPERIWLDQRMTGWVALDFPPSMATLPEYRRADLTTPDTRDALIKEQAAEITRLRAALAEKMVVKVKPLIFNNRGSEWWAMSPFGFYAVGPAETDHGDQWAIWYPETDIEDDPDGYASNEGAAMAVSQHAYDSRILSAVEAVPASQIRAEALREAAAKVHWLWNADGTKTERRVAVETAAAILALIDAPKVTT